MYNILELRSKSQDELLRIAQELGVKKANSLAPDALVYAILDQQAIVTSVDKKEESKTKKQHFIRESFLLSPDQLKTLHSLQNMYDFSPAEKICSVQL